MIDLNPGEKIIHEARKHWFVISRTGGSLFMIAAAPIILFFIVTSIFPDIATTLGEAKFNSLLALLGSSWLLLAWMMFFISWTDYYLDVLVVTNHRLIDVEQIGLFKRDIVTVPIKNIQDIKIETFGIVQTMLRFGDLHIQTAGYSKELMVKEIHAPAEVKQIIMSAYHAATESPEPNNSQGNL